MGIGENPNKVKNIVLGQPNSLSEFRLLYEPALDSLSRRGFIRIQKTDESTMIDVYTRPLL